MHIRLSTQHIAPIHLCDSFFFTSSFGIFPYTDLRVYIFTHLLCTIYVRRRLLYCDTSFPPFVILSHFRNVFWPSLDAKSSFLSCRLCLVFLWFRLFYELRFEILLQAAVRLCPSSSLPPQTKLFCVCVWLVCRIIFKCVTTQRRYDVARRRRPVAKIRPVRPRMCHQAGNCC